MPLASLADTDIRQFVLGVLLMPIFYCLLTVAATFLFKSSGGGIAFSIIILAIPALIRMFPGSIQQALLPVTPQSAIHSLSGTTGSESFESTAAFTSVSILILWLVITSVIAVVSFHKKDF
ncbi:hypothetical protein [Oceanobacillus timonensis]|uniref:hypothetical protein n=1 Tax=Oceanobacillus timonensis TaxID=1926285 RepID=UPI0009BA1098|nr:hypothetical protein [Oceanobacillus timonensis]